MKKLLFTAALAGILAGMAPVAQAAEGSDLLSKDRFMVRVRGIGVIPQE